MLNIQTIDAVHEAIASEKALLLNHPLYTRIKNITHLQQFTQYHVFAVWDFMSLLKALQIKLTCTQVPWFATSAPNTRYLINEIVLAEESDTYIDGRKLSHFEMYLDAMQTMGADTTVIEQLVNDLKSGVGIKYAIENLSVDNRIKAFLNFTFDIIEEGVPHKIASAFTFGREDLIPEMFSAILKEIQANFPEADLSKFVYYFQRHIELDGDEHGPLAMMMIQELAGDDIVKWEEMITTAKDALKYRIGMWDAINDTIS